MRVFDCDGHVEESTETWRFLDPEFHARRPIPITIPPDTDYYDWNAFWLIDHKVRHFAASPTTSETARKKGVSIGSQELNDVPARLADLERMGVTMQLVIPSLFLNCLAENVELEAALMRSYNTFMAGQCAESGGRLIYAAVVPWRAPKVAVKEIRRIKELGDVAAILARGMEWDTPLDHPKFLPIFEVAEREGLIIDIHTGQGAPGIMRLFEGMPESRVFHPLPPTRPAVPLESPLINEFGFSRLMAGGVMEDFPKLRWLFSEIGVGWLPHRMAVLERGGPPASRRLFDEARICITCEPEEDLPYVISKFGDEFLAVATDIPHLDLSTHQNPEEDFRSRGDLSESTLSKLLWENGARPFGVDEPSPVRGEPIKV